jgi:hypothetical protein
MQKPGKGLDAIRVNVSEQESSLFASDVIVGYTNDHVLLDAIVASGRKLISKEKDIISPWRESAIRQGLAEMERLQKSLDSIDRIIYEAYEFTNSEIDVIKSEIAGEVDLHPLLWHRFDRNFKDICCL